jgi:hypothetical protein
MNRVVVFTLIAAALASTQPGRADQAAGKRTWTQEKCFRYKRDWTEALRRWGTDGLSPAFLDGDIAFIDSGCESQAKICARSARELELVDVLTIRVVNAGMSSTFLPFGCPD